MKSEENRLYLRKESLRETVDVWQIVMRVANASLS